MSERKLLKVFLCHASEDKPTVRDLYKRLDAEGWIDAWLDKEKLLPGQDWKMEIEKAVEEADVVIACISSHSVTKEGFIQKELRYILEQALEMPQGTIFVIPLKLNDCETPRSLHAWQWVDYFPVPQRARAYERMLISLRQRAETLGVFSQSAGGASQEPLSVAQAPMPVPLISDTQDTDSTDGWTRSLRPEARPHAFVLMPFGKKELPDGSLYDFNAIYSQVIRPAVEAAGFECFREDEETDSGDIRTDMFQELLLADICIAEMSVSDANIFYKLGIRHAFRKRGVVHILAGQSPMPFEAFNVPTISYHLTMAGLPDPKFLEKDRGGISRALRDAWASDPNAVHSPIYNLLNGLAEPDRKMLRTPLATGFWREYVWWKERVTVAQRQRRIGDILLLTEEIQNPLIKEEAIQEAGQALKYLGRHDLALTLYRKGLELNPSNLYFRREEAFNLARLARLEEAIRLIGAILDDHPENTESIAYLARLYKEKWLHSWQDKEDAESRRQAAFAACDLLIQSFEIYLKSFLANPNAFYPGMNAATLGAILMPLAEQFDDPQEPDPDVRDVREKLPSLNGALELLLEEKAEEEKADYWTILSLAELRVLTAKSTLQVARAYRKAVSAAHENPFLLQASLQQLEILKSLNIRLEFVQAGMNVLLEELRRMGQSVEPEDARREKAKQEGRVFLFAGYMVSNPQKKDDHFPAEKEDELRAAIDALLERYKAGPDDLAVTTGFDAGSEILFGEACVERRIPVQVYFPVSEAPYVRDFVAPAGDAWTDRFYRLRSHPLVSQYFQSDSVGLPKEGDNVHERNNRWALYSALARGIDNVRLIAVWDGKAERSRDLDARLVKHMVDLMHDTGGIVEQIDPSKLTLQLKTLDMHPQGATSPSVKTKKSSKSSGS